MIRLGHLGDMHWGLNSQTEAIWEDYFRKYIAHEKVSAWLIAGDFAADEQEQIGHCFAFLRKYIPYAIPIIIVYGNHDYWSFSKKMTHSEVEKLHGELERAYNIHYLGNASYVIEDVLIVGFDGWYHHRNPPTKDHKYLAFQWVDGKPTMEFFRDKAAKDLDIILGLQTEGFRKVVGMSHFPTYVENSARENLCGNPSFLQHMAEFADVWLFGHSHTSEAKVVNECLLLNSGSGTKREIVDGSDPKNPVGQYDNAPKHIVFSV